MSLAGLDVLAFAGKTLRKCLREAAMDELSACSTAFTGSGSLTIRISFLFRAGDAGLE
jgi:hypothetical protein